ncbi:MAG: D-isomer specific 2-hydroxyacid dehydrogenase family protein [Atopobiaceae bacterium]|jgi:D-lactate dehydrogenase|nr:D-isomer specific 2-hydroxyacid dehydrogenase family protein [Atopobiaceae bacterium]
MRICAFQVRDDERDDFERMAADRHVAVDLHEETPTPGNAVLAAGCEGVTCLGVEMDEELLAAWSEQGVRYVGSRIIGTDEIDLDAARRLGMHVCGGSYPPDGVAEFAVMLMLMCLRQYKQALWRGQVNDFSLEGLEGRELGNLTVGVMGAGRIGRTVIRDLTGFGSRVIAYDPHATTDVGAPLVDLDRLLVESDVITLHMPLTDETHHIIGRSQIERMRDGVVLVNCARGGLMDTEALVWGIESGKVGALGLDVVEGEEGIVHRDLRVEILKNRDMAYLHQFRNVIMTQHMAFYTDVAVSHMVASGVGGICDMAEKGTTPTMLV